MMPNKQFTVTLPNGTFSGMVDLISGEIVCDLPNARDMDDTSAQITAQSGGDAKLIYDAVHEWLSEEGVDVGETGYSDVPKADFDPDSIQPKDPDNTPKAAIPRQLPQVSGNGAVVTRQKPPVPQAGQPLPDANLKALRVCFRTLYRLAASMPTDDERFPPIIDETYRDGEAMFAEALGENHPHPFDEEDIRV